MNRREFISKSAIAIVLSAFVPQWLQKLMAHKEVLAPLPITITLPYTGMFRLGDILHINDQRGSQAIGYISEVNGGYMTVRDRVGGTMPKRTAGMTAHRIASAYIEGRA